MISKLKEIAQGKKKIFYDLCNSNNLNLNYLDNVNELGILKSMFIDREYSDYFPFYKKVTIVDIGAHYGYFSIFAKNNSDKDSKILAIEPNISNFKQLKKNIKGCNISNITAYHNAIGSISGNTKLYHGLNPNHSILENYSLINQKDDFEEVEIKTLEKLIIENDLSKIDFLKMDCEGAEYSILLNTSKSIFDRIITISMEFHDLKDKNFTGETIIKLLIENGFEIVKYNYEKTSMNNNYGKIIGTKIKKIFGVNGC